MDSMDMDPGILGTVSVIILQNKYRNKVAHNDVLQHTEFNASLSLIIEASFCSRG